MWSKAIQANDIISNLLGSFTVLIRPNMDGVSYKIEIENALSLVSASRFDRDEKSKSIKGLIANHERDAKGVVELGGTLRCKWVWEEFL